MKYEVELGYDFYVTKIVDAPDPVTAQEEVENWVLNSDVEEILYNGEFGGEVISSCITKLT